MEFEKLTEESKYFLNLIESQVSSDFKINISHHSKSIRDIMDNLEGHLHKCLNKNNRYDHNTLKHDAPHMSIKAVELVYTNPGTLQGSAGGFSRVLSWRIGQGWEACRSVH